MRIIWISVGLIGGLLLQSTFFHFLEIWGCRPNLTMSWAFLTVLLAGPRPGLWAGFSGGLLLDLLGGHALGLGAASGLLTALGLSFIEERVFRDNWLIPVLLVGGGSLLYEGLYLLLGNAFGMGWSLVAAWRLLLPTALYNTLLAPLLFLLARRVLAAPAQGLEFAALKGRGRKTWYSGKGLR